jgi:hypothetical protein
MTTDRVFAVNYPDPKEAIEALRRARFEFECLLDYVATNHPAALVDEYGPQLATLAEEMHDEITSTWIKHL